MIKGDRGGDPTLAAVRGHEPAIGRRPLRNDDLVALWMPWGFGIADLPSGVRIWHGAQDTRGEPAFRYLSATLPGCAAQVWPGAGHYGVLRHWRQVLRPVG